MEKFSNWRDKGTGISPFIQSYPKPSVINYVLLIIKLPVFLILFPLSILLPIVAVRHFILRFLFNFNFKPIPSKGHIICNYSSPLLLFLTALPIYIPQDGTVYYYSPLKFIFHALNQNINGTITGTPVQKLPKDCIILIEGTSSNNKSVLKFQSIDRYELSNISTLIVKFLPNWVNVTLPTSATWFFLNLLVNGPSSINIKTIKVDNISKCSTTFSNANLKSVNFGIKDKWEFYDYYKHNS